MREITLSLIAGLVIGAIFKSAHLPVPVPHAVGGLAGLIGMFMGSEAVGYIIKAISSK